MPRKQQTLSKPISRKPDARLVPVRDTRETGDTEKTGYSVQHTARDTAIPKLPVKLTPAYTAGEQVCDYDSISAWALKGWDDEQHMQLESKDRLLRLVLVDSILSNLGLEYTWDDPEIKLKDGIAWLELEPSVTVGTVPTKAGVLPTASGLVLLGECPLCGCKVPSIPISSRSALGKQLTEFEPMNHWCKGVKPYVVVKSQVPSNTDIMLLGDIIVEDGV